MPEFGAELLGSLGLESLFGAGAEAGVGAAAGAASDFGLSELASAGLPFGAGAGELGSVATGLGPAGVSAFGDTGAILASLGGAGAAGIPLGAEATAAGLPAFAGAGQVGAVSDPSSVADALLGLGASSGTGIDLTGALSGAASGVGTPSADLGAPSADSGTSGADLSGLTTSNASLSQPTPVGPDVVSTPPQPAGPPQPTSFSGTTSVGPSAGTPAGPLSGTGFDAAQPVIGGQAPGGPGAVAPLGAAGTSSADLTTAGAVTGAPKAAETGGKSFLDNMVSGAGKSIQNNWLPALIAGGALGYNVLKGSQTPPAQQAIGTLPAANANLAATALGQIPAAQKIQDKALDSIAPVTSIQKQALDSIAPVTDIQKQATGAAGTALGQGSGLVDKGTGFTNYLPTATLPPDMQASLDSATAAAKTRIISNHGSRGLPTDPKKNSVLAQELAQADRDSLATKAQMEGQLLSSGTQLIGAGNQTTGAGTGLLGTGLNAAGTTGNLLGTGLNAAGTTGNLLGTGLNATQVTNQLVGTGLNATGLTSDIYNKLVSMDKADQKAVTDAVANFAKALGGTQGGLSLKLA